MTDVDAARIKADWTSIESDASGKLTAEIIGPGTGFYLVVLLTLLLVVGLPVTLLSRRRK